MTMNKYMGSSFESHNYFASAIAVGTELQTFIDGVEVETCLNSQQSSYEFPTRYELEIH
jgi:hypothetical protein